MIMIGIEDIYLIQKAEVKVSVVRLLGTEERNSA